GHDLCFVFVMPSIENLMLYACSTQPLAQFFGLLDRSGADEDRAALLVEMHDFFNDRVELSVLIGKDTIGQLLTDYSPISRDANDPQLVNAAQLPEVLCRGPGHSSELLVKSKIALESHLGGVIRRERDRDALLGLDRLVDALAPVTIGHPASRIFVDD